MEFVTPGVLFALITVSFIVGGFIQARLQRNHQPESQRLGQIVHLGPLSRETFAHTGRWVHFIWRGHYRCHDRPLSGLCIVAAVLQIAFLGVLFAFDPAAV